MKMKILIVDDEPDVLESTAGVVESLGYSAVRVSKASEILEALEREKPNVLLQDLKMPGLNVAGLVASIRSNPATADIPIVFFSANADISGTAARLDAWGYLSKPFAKYDLARLLDEAVGAPERIRAKAGRTLQRDVRGVFHDYWNLLAALSNYVVLLDEARDLPASLQKTVRGIDDVVLNLEAKTDRLQTYLLALVVPASEPPSTSSSAGSSEPVGDATS